MLRRFVNRC